MNTDTTFEEYAARLPEERRAAITAVRSVILDSLPAGYVERVTPGMLLYEVPLEISCRRTHVA